MNYGRLAGRFKNSNDKKFKNENNNRKISINNKYVGHKKDKGNNNKLVNKQDTEKYNKEKPYSKEGKKSILIKSKDSKNHQEKRRKFDDELILYNQSNETIHIQLYDKSKLERYKQRKGKQQIKQVDQVSNKDQFINEQEKIKNNITTNNTKTKTAEFDTWVKKIQHKQQYRGKVIENRATFKPSNYYKVLEEEDNEILEINKEKMPKLNVTKVIPVIEAMPEQDPTGEIEEYEQYNNMDVDTTEEEEFTTVVARQVGKERKMANEEYSQRFIPILLPKPIKQTEPPIKTYKVMPLTVNILAPHNGRYGFKKPRLLIALLRALQLVDKHTYYAPIDPLSNEPNIVTTENFPVEESELQHYVIQSTTGRNNNYVVKVVILSNTDVEQFKRNISLLEYFKEEKINIEYNQLDSVNPNKLGFLQNISTRHDTLDIWHARLLELLPKNIPKFQLSIQKIFVRGGPGSSVVMIKCDFENMNTLNKAFENLNDAKLITYFPFKEYGALPISKKITIIREQNRWYGQYRSLLLKGFIDVEDNIPMVLDPIEMETTEENGIDLTTISVTDYLRNHIKSGDGTNLFHNVYPTQEGTREFIVKIEHSAEAKEYLEIARGELARIMNFYAIEAVFDDPEQVIHDSDTQPRWKPHTRAKNIKESTYSLYDQSDPNRNIHKRNRNYNEKDFPDTIGEKNKDCVTLYKQPQKSYSAAVYNTKPFVPFRGLGGGMVPKPTGTSNTTDNSNTDDIIKIKQLEGTVTELQRTVNIIQTNIKMNNDKMLENIAELKAETKDIICTEIEANNEILQNEIQTTAKSTNDELKEFFKSLMLQTQHNIQANVSAEIHSIRGAMNMQNDSIDNKLEKTTTKMTKMIGNSVVKANASKTISKYIRANLHQKVTIPINDEMEKENNTNYTENMAIDQVSNCSIAGTEQIDFE
jgi:hypothetical protein